MLRHILHPIVLMRSAPRPRGAKLTQIEDLATAPVPEALREDLRRGAATLVSMGFSPALYATAATSLPIENCFALFEHPADGALGAIMVAVPKGRAFTSSTHFTTHFRDDWRIVTSNSPVASRTPGLPRVDGARFLGASLELLYKMHRARVAERARVTPIARPRWKDDPLGFQDREAREIQDFWVAKGVFRYVDGDRMKMTPLGAALAAWRGLFPWTLITALSRDRKARVLATRFGIRMSPAM